MSNSMLNKSFKRTSKICVAVISATLLQTVAADVMANSSESVTVAVRRMTESNYRHTIADVFGPDVEISARFEPEKREEGLLAIGSATLSLTSSGFEQYFSLANSISEQVLSEEKRSEAVPCTPTDPTKMDRTCANQFINNYGQLLFRRPLTKAEASARLETASIGITQSNDFYQGLRLALNSLLVAPEFLFRVENAEQDPLQTSEYRLDAYTKAARLSFLFWDSSPDLELLSAAYNGSLHTQAGLQPQLDRLTSSPKYERGIRALFEDMLQLDGFENMVKDPEIYPKFNQSVADSAKEQMLRTAVDILVTKNGDYRELFTSNDTFLNRPLASVYKVPFASSEEWTPFTFPESSERAGILTQVGFLSLHAHPGTSSPTRRGIKIHEIFMCELTPDPPADVDFSKVQALGVGTVRERLLDHMENTGCTACHRRSDPPGLALEHFDGLGQLRKYENGELIDVSAEFNGVNLVGAKGLGDFLKEDPRVPACLVRNVYAYGTGRMTDFWDEDYLADQGEVFAKDGYQLPSLMKQIANTPEFFKVNIPEGAKTASNTAPEIESIQTTAQVQQ